MRKAFLSLFALAVVLTSGCSKPAGNPITQTFNVKGNYTELEVGDAFCVLVSDTVNHVTITAGENIMPHVVVKVVDGALKIYIQGWHANLGNDMKVVLPYNASLTSVELSGASAYHSAFGLKGSEVDVSLSGASNFYCDIEADEVDIELSGASFISGQVAATTLDFDMSGASSAALEGTAEALHVDFSGASTLKRQVAGNRYAFACNRCEGSLSGSSNAYLHCDGAISVSLSGSSNLYYTGGATTRGCSSTGGSNISHDVL